MRIMSTMRKREAQPAGPLAARILLATSLLALASGPAFAVKARWSITRDISPPTVERRLTSPAIAHRGDTLHIVFKDNHIFYMRSLDAGKTWSYPVRVSGPNLANGAPCILADEDAIHVAYPAQVTDRESRYFQLFYTRSTDRGETFSKPLRLTDTKAQVRDPQFQPLRQGIGIFYVEVENISIHLKQPLDTQIFERWEENPLEVVIKKEEVPLLRSTVKLVKSVDGGRTFTESVRVSDRGKLIENFIAYPTGEGVITVSFEEEGRYLTLESKDDGDTWAPNYDRGAILSRWEIADLVYMRGDLHKVWIPMNPGRKVQVWYQDITTGEQPEAISQPMLVTSPPRMVVGDGEIHVVWSVRTENISRLAYQRTDHSPPKSTIVSPADPGLGSAQVVFEWTGSDDLSDQLHFSYRFTGDEWSPFAAAKDVTIEAPPDGEYLFEVRARDDAGNVEPEAVSIRFNTFKVPPDTFFMETPPDPLAARYVTFAWSGSDNTETAEQLAYSYSWDGGEWTEFAPIRTARFGPLREAEHQFLVRSRDRRGNADPEPAESRFFVDVGMKIAFVAPPPTAINLSEIQLSWQGTDQTGEEPRFLYAVQRDDEPWTPFRDIQGMNITSLAQGPHTVRIKAQDIAGNESNVLEHHLVVDYEPPQAFAKLDFIDKDRGGLPVISVGGSDNLTPDPELRFEYRIIGQDWAPIEGRTISVPRPVKWYSPGYVVEVMAKDNVDNPSAPVQVSLRFFDRLQHNRTQLFILLGATVAFIGVLVLLVVYFVIQRRRLTLEAEEEAEAPEEAPSEEEGLGFEEPTEGELDLGESSEDEDDLFK